MALSIPFTSGADEAARRILVDASDTKLPVHSIELGYFVMGDYSNLNRDNRAANWKMLRAYWEYRDERGAFCTSTVHHHQTALPEEQIVAVESLTAPLFVPKKMDDVYLAAKASDLLSSTPIYGEDRCFPDLIGRERLDFERLTLGDLDRETMNKAVAEMQKILGTKKTFSIDFIPYDLTFPEISQGLVDKIFSDIDGWMNTFMELGLESVPWLTSMYVAPEDLPVIESFFFAVSGTTDLEGIRNSFGDETAPVNPVVVDGYSDWGRGIDDFKVYPKVSYGNYTRFLNNQSVTPNTENQNKYISWLPLVDVDADNQQAALTYEENDGGESDDEHPGHWRANLALLLKPIEIAPFTIAAEYCRANGLEYPPAQYEEQMVAERAIKKSEKLMTHDQAHQLFEGELNLANLNNHQDGFTLTRVYPAGFRCIQK
jgi:hypothetical protein